MLTETDLRELRDRPAADIERRKDLLLRMHILPQLRGDNSRVCLPELRRRLRAAPDQVSAGMEERRYARNQSGGSGKEASPG